MTCINFLHQCSFKSSIFLFAPLNILLFSLFVTDARILSFHTCTWDIKLRRKYWSDLSWKLKANSSKEWKCFKLWTNIKSTFKRNPLWQESNRMHLFQSRVARKTKTKKNHNQHPTQSYLVIAYLTLVIVTKTGRYKKIQNDER